MQLLETLYRKRYLLARLLIYLQHPNLGKMGETIAKPSQNTEKFIEKSAINGPKTGAKLLLRILLFKNCSFYFGGSS